MSLIVEVSVGSHLHANRRRLVASMVLHNVSDLAKISNYTGYIEEENNDNLGIKGFHTEISVKDHERHQSVWELIKTALEKV